MRARLTASFALALSLTPCIATARPDGRGLPSSALQSAEGLSLRALRTSRPSAAPAARRDAWALLHRESGAAWAALWDPATGSPSRLWGRGIAAPGTVASAEAAERFARAFLARHLGLLAPGCAPTDFELVTNELHDGLRSLGFAQRYAGLPVVGGQVSFGFKRDRLVVLGSQALPSPSAPTTLHGDTHALRGAALRWATGFAARVDLGDLEGPLVLPLIGDAGVLGYRVAYRAVAETASPAGSWELYVDAATGAPLARRSRRHFGEAGLRLRVPAQYPAAGYTELPAGSLYLVQGTSRLTADEDGVFNWPGDDARAGSTLLRGEWADVTNAHGASLSRAWTLSPGTTSVWGAETEPEADAQLAVFAHLVKAKAFLRGVAPDLLLLRNPTPASVNLPSPEDACNAWSDGTRLGFGAATWQCENPGRIAGIVYHELGHSVHITGMLGSIAAFDDALSEGLADYLDATLRDDSAIGRGLFLDGTPVREIDPVGEEAVWPEHVDPYWPHYTGEIASGALWDLRKLLIASEGPAAGRQLTDRLWFAAVRRAVDIPSVYVEALVADDDDGDLANGTPHACAIDDAFRRHGLVPEPLEDALPGAVLPRPEGFRVATSLGNGRAACGADAIVGGALEWRRRGTVATQSIALAQEPGQLAATLPAQPPGTVVEYRFALRLASGALLNVPRNEAAPYYELYVGETTPLYCTDFETNVFQEGWRHGAGLGAEEESDGWQWGTLASATGSGDPRQPFSGTGVAGTGLGRGRDRGYYPLGTLSYATTPPIDTRGYAEVRLQYRRWLTTADATPSIRANDKLLWQSPRSARFEDRGWRFHDLDLSSAVRSGKVSVTFTLDAGYELGGGFTLDDLCIVGVKPAAGAPSRPERPSLATTCGDGALQPPEECDHGADNGAPGDSCTARCAWAPTAAGGGCQLPRAPLERAQPTATGALAVALLCLARRRRVGSAASGPSRSARREP